MIVLRSHDVDVAYVKNVEKKIDWEREARETLDELAIRRETAVRLLSSDDGNLRRLALLSFHYRWPIDDEVFQLVRPIAVRDPDLELRIIANSLLFAIHLRCDRTDREAVRAAMLEVANEANQDPDIQEFAQMHYRVTDDPFRNAAPVPERTEGPTIPVGMATA